MKEKIKAIRWIITETSFQDPGARLIFAICGEKKVEEIYKKYFWEIDLENASFEDGFKAGKAAISELIQIALRKTAKQTSQSN